MFDADHPGYCSTFPTEWTFESFGKHLKFNHRLLTHFSEISSETTNLYLHYSIIVQSHKAKHYLDCIKWEYVAKSRFWAIDVVNSLHYLEIC